MSKSRSMGEIFQKWGGSTATFFSYIHLSHDLTAGLLIGLLPLIREDLGLNYLQSGLLIGAYSLTSGLSQLPGGWLGDRISRHLVITTGLVGVSLATFAVSLSSAYYPMLFILVIRGIFTGAYHPSATSMLASQFEASKRGKAIALHMVGGSIGFAIGPILGGLVAGMLGWRFAFIILSIPALVAAPLVLNRFRQQRSVKSEVPVSQSSTQDNTIPQATQRSIGIGQALRPIALIVGLVMLMQLISGTAVSFIPIYLVDKHHIAATSAAMLMGMIRGAGIVGSLFGGWLSDWYGRKNTIILGLVATGPIIYLLTRLPFGAGLIAIFILFGMLSLMRQAAVQPFLMDSVPTHLRATIFGLYFGLGMEGRSLIQPVTGHFMDIFGIVEVFNVIALISVGFSVVVLISARSLKSRQPTR